MIGTCPACNGQDYAPDPAPGGAGRNKCLRCGHLAPVRDFHQPREPWRFTDWSKIARYSPGGTPVTSDIFARLYMQQPEPRPEGTTWDDRTETLKPAAPIRQYKDD